MLRFYQIPCSCGKIHEVSTTQAGSSFTCECGKIVSVPSLREIQTFPAIERRDSAEEESLSQVPAHGIRQRRTGLLFVLFTAFLLFTGGTIFSYVNCPQEPSVTNAKSPYEVWAVWQTLRTGIDTPATRGEQFRTDAIKMSHRWIVIESSAAVLCVLGMFVLLLTGVQHEKTEPK